MTLLTASHAMLTAKLTRDTLQATCASILRLRIATRAREALVRRLIRRESAWIACITLRRFHMLRVLPGNASEARRSTSLILIPPALAIDTRAFTRLGLVPTAGALNAVRAAVLQVGALTR